MKCINRKRRKSVKRRQTNSTNRWEFRQKRKNRRKLVGILFFLILAVLAMAAGLFLITRTSVASYESKTYSKSVAKNELYTNQICVSSKDVAYDKFNPEIELDSAGLFQLEESETIYAENIHEKVYPASITKMLTAYLALKYGNLDDVVTVGENAMNVPWDSSKAYLKLGDQLTLRDLLYSLMLASGNDSAVAIAEHISGSEEAFVSLMNEEANKMGATNTHFTNSHGYHDDNHYTTAYDLYLILNKCIENEEFVKIITDDSYSVEVKQVDGSMRKMTWRQSNMFLTGEYEIPDNITLLGGKTGTTLKAGACLILYVEDSNSKPYISVVMGAESKTDLYESMNKLISTIGN